MGRAPHSRAGRRLANRVCVHRSTARIGPPGEPLYVVTPVRRALSPSCLTPRLREQHTSARMFILLFPAGHAVASLLRCSAGPTRRLSAITAHDHSRSRTVRRLGTPPSPSPLPPPHSVGATLAATPRARPPRPPARAALTRSLLSALSRSSPHVRLRLLAPLSLARAPPARLACPTAGPPRASLPSRRGAWGRPRSVCAASRLCRAESCRGARRVSTAAVLAVAQPRPRARAS